MIDVPTSKHHAFNRRGLKTEFTCFVCGRDVNPKRAAQIHVHNGGASIVTEAEAATLDERGDMGQQWVGSECLRQHPQIKPYVIGRRLTATELKAGAATRAGCVRLSYCRRGSGPMVGVYKSDEAGMESDPSHPWSVVCEKHHTIVRCETKAAALSTASDTCNFCDECRTDGA